MLNLPKEPVFGVRSTGRISAKGMRPFIDMLESSEALMRFDRNRCRPGGALKYSAVNMMTVITYIEIRKISYEEYETTVKGRGGQVILRNLGMPTDANGRYLAPSRGWISDFRNHLYYHFGYELELEMRNTVLQRMKESDRNLIVTVDSTPLEASRYSEWAEFNVHYNIRMAKAHIIMVNGVPLTYSFTNGRAADGPEFIRLLQGYDSVQLRGIRILSDGGYASHDTYLEVFRRTGMVMSSNIRHDGIVHEEATYPKLIRLYNGLNRNRDFVPQKHITPGRMLRYLANHGYGDRVGWFLRNLDMCRGDRIHCADAKDRHVCETVHHGMKRWVSLDVRGLNRKYAEKRIRIRLFICSMLCFVFEPYC